MVSIKYNLSDQFLRNLGDPTDIVGNLTGVQNRFKRPFAEKVVAPYMKGVENDPQKIEGLKHFNPSTTHVGRFAVESLAERLLPEGSYLNRSWKASYANGINPADVGWDTITIRSQQMNDLKNLEEMAVRLNQAGVPVQVTNDSGEELLQLLSSKPLDFNEVL